MSAGGIVPGEIIVGGGDIEINPGRTLLSLPVRNTGDRPVQVGSHYHFAEANAALDFDRDAAWGHRLAVPAGTSVRFEPGMPRDVTLVALGGNRVVPGLRGLAGGPLDPSPRGDIEPAGSLDSPADEDPAAFTGTSPADPPGAIRGAHPGAEPSSNVAEPSWNGAEPSWNGAEPSLNGAEPDELAGEELPTRAELPGDSADLPGEGAELSGGERDDHPENGSPR